jgi:hypothetical protein
MLFVIAGRRFSSKKENPDCFLSSPTHVSI